MIIELNDLHLGGISFQVTRADGKRVDFSQLVTAFSLGDSVNVAGTEVVITAEGPANLINAIGQEGSTAVVSAPLPDVATGRVVRREMWRGFFEDVSDDRSSRGVVRRITAYDPGKLLATHEEDYVFKGSTLSQVVTRIAKDFEIPVGSVPSTSRALGNIVSRGDNLWSTIQKAVQRHHDLTGETYRVKFEAGKIHLVRQGAQTHWWVFEVGRSLHGLRRSRTIADLENRVKIYGEVKDELSHPKVEAVIENTQSQRVYGLRQRVEYLSEADDRKKVRDLAQQRIDLRSIPDETIEVSGWAVPLLRGGEKIRVIDQELGVTGMFFVENVDCQWTSDGATSVALCRREPITPGLFMDQLVVA